jgi:IQ calmodulin-binding motif
MGNCCSGNANEGEVTMMKGGSPHLNNDYFDDREILGLRGNEKIALIIKIQSMFRGRLARKRVQQRYGFKAKTL